jgi:hypothetical protein
MNALAIAAANPVTTRHGLSYDAWLARAGRPRGGKSLHAAWWAGKAPESCRPRRNPIGGGGTVLLALLAAGAGGAITYFGLKYFAPKMTVTDGIAVAQAQANLAHVSQPGALTPATPALTPFTLTPATVQSATLPAFVATLAQFQAWVNTNGPSIMAQIQVTFAAPTLPLRIDGVLDQATSDWLVIVANA